MGSYTTTETMTLSSPSPSTSPYDSEIEEPRRIQSLRPLKSRKILSRQLSMSETERDLAWEKKRHQMRMQEQKRLNIENSNELSDEDLNELKGCDSNKQAYPVNYLYHNIYYK